MERKRVRWGIIGCGKVCEVKSGPAFYKSPESELVAVMRRNGELAADYARRHNVPKWYDDADALIADPDVTAVYVATPPESHLRYAAAAMKAGKPVYVEKPMARNFSESLEMIEVSRRSGQQLHVAYYRRALPYFLKIKELIDSGVIGKLLGVNLRYARCPRPGDDDPARKDWHVQPEISGGGYLIDTGSHQINLLQYYFGQVVDILPVAQNLMGWYEPEEYVAAILLFKSGLTATCTWNYAASTHEEQDVVEISGRQGVIRFSVFRMDTIEVLSDTLTETIVIAPEVHVHYPMVQIVNNAILNDCFHPARTIDAAETARIIDRITKRQI